jgi:hypothetical protein
VAGSVDVRQVFDDPGVGKHPVPAGSQLAVHGLSASNVIQTEGASERLPIERSSRAATSRNA